MTSKKFNEKIMYFIIFLCIYFSHDTLMFGTNISESSILIRKIIPFVVLALLFTFYIYEIHFSIEKMLLAFLVGSLPIVSCIFNNEDFPNYLYRFTIMLNACLLALLNNKYNIIEKFTRIILFFTVCSLIVFPIYNLFPSISNYFPHVINSGKKNFAIIFFSVVNTEKSNLYGFSRNLGIFREPGVFMVYIIICIIFEIKKDEKMNYKRLMIFILGLLTTGSSAGLISLTFIFIYLIMLKSSFKYKIPTAIFIFVLGIIAYNNFGDSAIASKFTYGTNSYGSFYARYMSLVGNINIIIKNPIFGCGRYNLYGIQFTNDNLYKAVDNTNTILIGYAAYGLMYGIITTSGLLKFSKFHENSLFSSLLVFLIFFLTLSNEDMGQSVIYYFMIFYGLFLTKKELKKGY